MVSVRGYRVTDVQAQEALGAHLARVLAGRGVVYLQGELGAGKTTLSRGILRAYGHMGAVKSPTYTLVEPYELAAATVYHFDLYRVKDPEELELLGIRDYCRADTLALIEWPECGAGMLPLPDLSVTIKTAAIGRAIEIAAGSAYGQLCLGALPESVEVCSAKI